MSIKVMSKVWDNSKQKGSTLLLLLAIADFADENGKAWPSIETLAKKIRMTPRSAQLMVRKLVEEGELEVEQNAGPHGCNLYTVKCLQGENFSGVKTFQGEKIDRGGEKNDTKGVKYTSPDPSLDPPIDPSIYTPNGAAPLAQSVLLASGEKKTRKPTETQAEAWAWIEALCYAFEDDPKIPGMAGKYGKLGKGYAKAGYTPDDVRTWKDHLWPTDWRYEKGHKPSKAALDERLPEIREHRLKGKRARQVHNVIDQNGNVIDTVEVPL